MGWSMGQKYQARNILQRINEASPDWPHWQPLINHFPWLNAFYSSDFSNDWNPTIQVFHEDANQATASENSFTAGHAMFWEG